MCFNMWLWQHECLDKGIFSLSLLIHNLYWHCMAVWGVLCTFQFYFSVLVIGIMCLFKRKRLWCFDKMASCQFGCRRVLVSILCISILCIDFKHVYACALSVLWLFLWNHEPEHILYYCTLIIEKNIPNEWKKSMVNP